MSTILNNSSGQIVKPLLQNLSKLSTIFIFGGAVRDNILSKGKIHPKDYDIVYVGNKEEVEESISKYVIKKNKFDGNKLSFNGVEIDIWNIKESYYLKESKLHDMTSLLNSTYSSLESALYCINNDSFYFSKYFIHSKKYKEMGIVNPVNLYPLGASLKALNMSIVYDIKINKTSSDKIKTLLTNATKHELLFSWSKNFKTEFHESIIDEILNSEDQTPIKINTKKHNLTIKYVRNRPLIENAKKTCKLQSQYNLPK